MRSANFKTQTMQYYAKWNKALYEHFFPLGQEDPLLFVDDTLLEDIGSNIFSEENKGENSWTEFFLLYTLFKKKQIGDFKKDFNIADGRIASTWNSIVTYLLSDEPLFDGIPSYFAIICVIMYVAQKEGADHSRMKSFASVYLETDNRTFAERIDELFTQLHKDRPSFNHQRMVTRRTLSTRVNISRVKYHLVLNKREKDDFIDFIEVNNLKWDCGTYKDFADCYLLPSLAEANKTDFIEKVKKEENNPYFKNLLTLPNLQFGKPTSTSNQRQESAIYWRYELKFDFNTGEPVFIMTTGDFLSGITFDGKEFKFDSNSSEVAAPLGSDVSLQIINYYRYSKDSHHYVLKNIASGKIFYFESSSHNCFHQVSEITLGKHYLLFVPKKKRGLNTCPDGWNVVTDFSVAGYDVFETNYYKGKEISVDIKKDKVTDPFSFYRIGSYCRISLHPDEQLWWESNVLSAHEELIDTFSGADGFTYFRLKTNEGFNYINGSLSVKSSDGKYVLTSEYIYFEQKWDNYSQKYGINGWGNTVPSIPLNGNNTVGCPTAWVQPSYQKTEHADMLLNILCELADKDGCVSEVGLKNALNFVLQFNGISDPDYNNRKKLIYALQRLGYIIDQKDTATGKHSNQLLSPFVEKTLYYALGKNSSPNLYLVKGAYSDKELKYFIDQNCITTISYKRPYENRIGNLQTPGYCAENDSPEYKCLPDLVLFEFERRQDVKKWTCIQAPYADILLSSIGDMSKFASRFLNDAGDPYSGNCWELPEMIEDNYHKECICFKNQLGQVRTLKNYYDSESQRYLPIPKHLARLYCENEKNYPICIINTEKSKDTSFLHKMGIPRVLDMALCDLNLGLPDEHKVFVIDHQNSNLPMKISEKGNSIPYSDIKTYHNINSVDWLKKLSSENHSPQYTPHSISLDVSKWKMYLDKHRIVITYRYALFAFAEYGNVYLYYNETQALRVRDDRSVNEILSDMLKDCSNIHSWSTELVPVKPPKSITGLTEMDII